MAPFSTLGKTGKKHRKFRRFPVKRPIPIRILIPNLITLMGLSAGLTAIRMGIEHRYELAIAAILIAAVLDALDGRVARMLKATSRFGAELDSLADFVNFGVAPAMIIFIWALDGLRSLGWIAVLVYALCAALRLARFNVALDDEDAPTWTKNYFSGIPAPAAAITVLLPMYFSFLGVPGVEFLQPLILLHVLFIALMMVSKIPTFSGKLLGAKIDREYVLPLMVAVVIIAALLFTYNWAMLILGTLIYLALIPYSYLRYRTLAARDKLAEEKVSVKGKENEDKKPKGAELEDKHQPHTGRLQ
ncbi:MAG: CDP-diacylglycerol--serine O-phosphatidyltransferase [Hyphomicrobiaceae bacterium]|nr:CDP-diacylglycerol--serine O-phosphatidyltransferase [Hyphomicrobiaceae bacterium]